MRNAWIGVGLLGLALGTTGLAEEPAAAPHRRVLVELFTSQG